MDIREHWEALEQAIRVAVATQFRARFSSFRVTVGEDSQDGHTAVLQPVTQMNVLQPDGSIQQVDFPQLLDCPIAFPGGGGVTRTHPVKKDDEGKVVFSSSPIDVWHQQGGTQQQIDTRTYSLSDGTYIPGGRSDPRKIQKVSTVSDQTRSDDGNHIIDTHPQNGITHQSTNMVLGTVGNSTSHLLTMAGVQTVGPKVCLNCG